MQETLADGQDALRLASLRMLARAARTLVEEGRVSTEGLLPAYRALAPLGSRFGHTHVAADVLDVAFLGRCHLLGGDALLAAATVHVCAAPPRAHPRVVNAGGVVSFAAAGDHASGDALALALGLSLEAAKLAHGLPAPTDLLRVTFAQPGDAKRALDALRRGGAAREVDASAFLEAATARVDGRGLAALAHGRPVYVVVGAGGRRVLDLLSPFARRLRTELAALGAGHGGSRADDVYAGVLALCAHDDGIDDERLLQEASVGVRALGPGATAVSCELLVESQVDGRVRESALALKRARALVVCVEERAASLAAVLAAIGPAGRAIFIVVEGSGSAAPAFAGEMASAHVAVIDNALAAVGESAKASLTLPSLALHSTATPGLVEDALFPLVQATLRARVLGVLPSSARLGVTTVPAGDVTSLSMCCIELLGTLGPPQREPRSGPRR